MLPLQPLARHLAKELETPRHHHNWWQRCLLPRRRSSSRSRRKTRRRRRRRRWWWTRWSNLLGSRSISCWCGGLRIGDQISNHFLRFSPNLVKPPIDPVVSCAIWVEAPDLGDFDCFDQFVRLIVEEFWLICSISTNLFWLLYLLSWFGHFTNSFGQFFFNNFELMCPISSEIGWFTHSFDRVLRNFD